ncbi:MAG: hypothetical protein KGN30_08635, partial [Nitrospirota bacterium]|nr:hypothetical protein [Nitrospirota bacterium]
MTTGEVLEIIGSLVSALKAYCAKLPAVVHLSMIPGGVKPTPEAIEAYEQTVYRFRTQSAPTPFRTLTKYNLTLIQAGQDRDTLMNFLRMEKWLADRPDHPGAAAQQWLKELYQDNKLFRGELVIDGRLVDLGAVVMPVLNVYSETDTIIHP